MRRGKLQNSALTVAVFGLAIALSGCGSSEGPNDPGALGGGGANGTGPGGTNGQPAATPDQQVQQILDARTTDYGEAARTAKLKLNDQLPTLDEINQIAAAADNAAKKVVYEKLVDSWVDSPLFAAMMVKYWKDTLRTGQVGTIQTGMPDLDKAALFAAQVTVEGRSFGEILTASSNTCPTFDATAGTFTAASCAQNATGPTSGVLTDPGIQAQYFSNMAMRRTRFVQETFACSKFPAEFGTAPKPMGNGTYTNPWDFNRVVGKQNTPTARIDFQDTSAVICANCHGTINGIAPLFLNYDAKGVLQATSQVLVPIPGNPKAAATDYLTSGQPLAWRMTQTITDIPSLGKAMAADPEVAKCAVNRVWNYAMSRGDIVNDLAAVPDTVTAPLVASFSGGGMKLKDTVRAVFKADDFTKF